MIVGDANDIFQSFAKPYLAMYFGEDKKAEIAKIDDDFPQLKAHYEKIRSLPQLVVQYATSDKMRLTAYFSD
jgi:hypothetical protein